MLDFILFGFNEISNLSFCFGKTQPKSTEIGLTNTWVLLLVLMIIMAIIMMLLLLLVHFFSSNSHIRSYSSISCVDIMYTMKLIRMGVERGEMRAHKSVYNENESNSLGTQVKFIVIIFTFLMNAIWFMFSYYIYFILQILDFILINCIVDEIAVVISWYSISQCSWY